MKLRLGIVGAGYVVSKNYLPALVKRDDCEIVAICSGRGDSARALAATAKVPRVCANLGELLAMSDVDVVCICTPPHLHREQAEEALAAGKHVLLEKPVAPTLAESLALLRLGARARPTFGVVFNQSCREENAWLQEQMRSGALGTVELVDLQWLHSSKANDPRAWKRSAAQAGGGILFDLGPHLLHLALGACPDRREARVWSRFVRRGAGPDAVDERAFCMVTLAGGPCLQIRLASDLPAALGTRVRYEAFGSAGVACAADYTGPKTTGWEPFFDRFFAHVREGTRPDLALVADVMRVLDAAYRAESSPQAVILRGLGE